MKKIIIALLAVAALCGCGKGSTDEIRNTQNDIPMTVEFAGRQISGVYTENPQGGENTFTADELVYKGEIKDGKFCGKGSLTADNVTIKMYDADGEQLIQGKYDGSTMDGMPEGEGVFDNSYNTYTGSWKNGTFDGQGCFAFKNSFEMNWTGTFVGGKFTPTVYDMFVTFGTSPIMEYTVNENAAKLIKDKPQLFPANTADELQPYIDPNAGVDDIFGGNTDKIIKVDITLDAAEPSSLYGRELTYLAGHKGDKNVVIYCLKSITDKKAGDTLRAYVLPLGETQAADGTPGYVTAGAYIE